MDVTAKMCRKLAQQLSTQPHQCHRIRSKSHRENVCVCVFFFGELSHLKFFYVQIVMNCNWVKRTPITTMMMETGGFRLESVCNLNTPSWSKWTPQQDQQLFLPNVDEKRPRDRIISAHLLGFGIPVRKFCKNPSLWFMCAQRFAVRAKFPLRQRQLIMAATQHL